MRYLFSHHASVFRIDKKYPFVQTEMLSVLSVLIGRSMLCLLATGDVGMNIKSQNYLVKIKLPALSR